MNDVIVSGNEDCEHSNLAFSRTPTSARTRMLPSQCIPRGPANCLVRCVRLSSISSVRRSSSHKWVDSHSGEYACGCISDATVDMEARRADVQSQGVQEDRRTPGERLQANHQGRSCHGSGTAATEQIGTGHRL